MEPDRQRGRDEACEPSREWVISQLIAEFAKRGLTLRERADGALISSGGYRYSVSDAIKALDATPPEAWPARLADYVQDITSLWSDIPRDPRELRLVVLPVIAAPNVRGMPLPTYAADLGAGLQVAAAVDFPDMTLVLRDGPEVERLGGWEGLAGAAIGNLCLLPEPTHRIVPVRGTGSEFHVFEGDSFVASRLLIVDEIMAGAGCPTTDVPLVVGLPIREMLAVHRVAGAASATVIAEMSRFVARQFEEKVAPISPHLYFRDGDGRWWSVAIARGAGSEVAATGPVELLRLLATDGAQPNGE